jgi:hypothetical protein
MSKQVKRVVEIPHRHPMTGKIEHRLTTVIDRLVDEEGAAKLTRHYKRKAAVVDR